MTAVFSEGSLSPGPPLGSDGHVSASCRFHLLRRRKTRTMTTTRVKLTMDIAAAWPTNVPFRSYMKTVLVLVCSRVRRASSPR